MRAWSFSSPAFPLEPDEAEPANLGLGGRRLCAFLRAALSSKGVQASEPAPEDWGYGLRLRFAGRRFLLGCGAVSGKPDRFLVFLEPVRGLWPSNPGADLKRLGDLVAELLAAHPEIEALREER